MNNFQRTKGGRLAALVFAGLVLVLVVSVGSSEAGPCERAFGKCLIDAGLPSLASMLASGGLGVVVVLVMSQFCGSGYLFCLQYCQ